MTEPSSDPSMPLSAKNFAAPQTNYDAEYGKRIILTNCPFEMTKQGIYNLCSRYGEISKPVHEAHSSNNIFFVEYESLSAAEQAIRYINETKDLGIKADFARSKQNENANSENNMLPLLPYAGDSRENARSEIDMTRRSVKGPFTKPINMIKHFAHPSSADTLDLVLPYYKVLQNVDNYVRVTDGRYRVVNGRGTFNENSRVIASMQNLAQKSNGHFDPATNVFSYNAGMPKDVGVVGGLCLRCTLPGVRKCSNCSMWYCSIECQNFDWDEHESECFALASSVPISVEEQGQLFILNKVEQSKKTASINNNNVLEARRAPFPKSGDFVVITTVRSVSVVYVRACNPEIDLEFARLIQDIGKYAIQAKFLKKKPDLRQIVLAPYEGFYYRALILPPNDTCTDELVKIAFIDYGNISVEKWCYFKVLDDEQLICATRLGFQVSLQGVDFQKHMNDEAIKLLYKCLDEGEKLKIVYEGAIDPQRSPEVILYQDTNNISVNETIKKLSVVVPPNIFDTEVFGTQDLVMKGVPDGRNQKIIVLDTSLLETGSISGILYNDRHNLAVIHQKVQDYCATTTVSYMPRLYEQCLALIKNDANTKAWYRGQCIESIGDQYPTICFIDYGNISPVYINDIRRIPKELALLPVYTKLCVIDGLPEDCKDLLPELQTYFVDKVIEVDEIKNVVSKNDEDSCMDSYALLTINEVKKNLKL